MLEVLTSAKEVPRLPYKRGGPERPREELLHVSRQMAHIIQLPAPLRSGYRALRAYSTARRA